jgi:hypothetical protein
MRIFSSAVLLATLWACLPQPPAAAPPSASERRILSGVLAGTTVLSGEVEMVGDLLVPAGASLQILAGTTIYIRPAEGSKIDPEYLSPATELLVRGSLHVAGTEAAPVRFLRLGEAAADPWWAGIILDGAHESSIAGAEIEGAETGILCLRSSPRLTGNRLQHCRYGIIAQQQSAPFIVGNRVAAGEGGIFCWRGSHPQLEDNSILDQAEEGLFIDAESRPFLGRNTISGCAIGVALYPREIDLSSLILTSNGENVRRLGAGRED